MKRLLYFFFLCLIISSCSTNRKVDLVVYNARVYTVDSAFTIYEAFAVNNGVFVDVGTTEQMMHRYDPRESYDAKEAAVYPGFFDAHCHFMMYAESLETADLSQCSSFDQVIHTLREHEKKFPQLEWVLGHGWDQNKWKEKKFPTRDSLDKYFPKKPVFLSRVDYRAALANSKALEISGIQEPKYVEGGLILADSAGRMSGILMDEAINLVHDNIPERSDEQSAEMLIRAQDSLFKRGLTSIVDAGVTIRELDVLRNYYNIETLKIRNYAMVSDEPENILNFVRKGSEVENRLTVRAVKLMADGALGSRGACLLDPYSDDTTNYGFLRKSPFEFDQLIKALAESDFQVATHAIGDSTNRFILNVYGKYLKNPANRRWRIEHAQVVNEEDFSKFDKYRVFPSIQPTHATSDMYWAEDRLGPTRVRNAYAYKRLVDNYGMIAIGSDFPVENINPLYGFHAAVARKDASGYPANGYEMKNALTRREALQGMTIWAAFSCFQENRRGSIERGKDADYVILDKDMMIVPEEELRNINVLQTVLGGEVVYNAG